MRRSWGQYRPQTDQATYSQEIACRAHLPGHGLYEFKTSSENSNGTRARPIKGFYNAKEHEVEYKVKISYLSFQADGQGRYQVSEEQTSATSKSCQSSFASNHKGSCEWQTIDL